MLNPDNIKRNTFTQTTASHNYARNCVQPGFDYFNQQLTSSLKGPLLAFKAARLLSPQKLHAMQPDATAVDTLTAFPFYQPGAREAHARLVLRLLYVPASVCLCECVCVCLRVDNDDNSVLAHSDC